MACSFPYFALIITEVAFSWRGRCRGKSIAEMNILKYSLDRFESRLQALIEGSAARLFPGYDDTWHLAHQLVEAMRNGIQIASDGNLVVPNQLLLQAHPRQIQVLQSSPWILAELKAILVQAVSEAGMGFLDGLDVQVEPVPYLAEGVIRIVPQPVQNGMPHTETVIVKRVSRDTGVPKNAYLIINGTRRFSLDQSVINIGRHEENHLVINDPSISRRHAQLRLVRDHYEIFDLQSAGGIWIKGQRVHRWKLSPGDVIVLSNIPLFYHHDVPALGDTQDFDASIMDG